MNAVTFLIKEHDKIRQTLIDIANKSHRYTTKKKMFDILCKFLIRHEMMEQKIWYPKLRKNKKVVGEIKHLISEEKSAEKAIKAIKKFKSVKTQKEWETKFSKFTKAVQRHANEEETKLFPRVEKLFDETDLKAIGVAMRKYKSKFKSKKTH